MSTEQKENRGCDRPSVRRYTKTILDEVQPSIEDVQAHHIGAKGALSMYGGWDFLMDKEQEEGYALIRLAKDIAGIIYEAGCPEPSALKNSCRGIIEALDQAEHKLAVRAEHFEAQAEAEVEVAQHHVLSAHDATRSVLHFLNSWRPLLGLLMVKGWKRKAASWGLPLEVK